MTKARRIDRLPDCPIPQGDRVQFQFEGRTVEGFSGEPLAAALLASGVRVFGRSIKYHRPRGPTCLRAHCSSCLMRVDGQPSVRTCETPCRAGAMVERQGGWPGSNRDMLRAIDWMYPTGMKPHEMFTASATIGRMAMPFVRRMAGYGEPPSGTPPPPKPLKTMAAEVVVIGAGASGLSAARAIASGGRPVLLLEAEDRIGGRRLDATDVDPGKRVPAWQGWKEWKTALDGLANVELKLRTPVLAVYAGPKPQVLAVGEQETLLIQAERLVICTGAYEQIPLFANNDLPGIFGIRALDKLVFGYGVLPGEPVAVLGDSDQALALALLLVERHVAVAGVITNRQQGELIGELKAKGVSVIADRRVVRARGGRWLESLELAPADRTDPDVVLDCALCAAEAPPAPAYELAHHIGCRVQFRSFSGYGVVVDDTQHTSHDRVFAAGHCTLAAYTAEAERQGERAGQACLASFQQDPGRQETP